MVLCDLFFGDYHFPLLALLGRGAPLVEGTIGLVSVEERPTIRLVNVFLVVVEVYVRWGRSARKGSENCMKCDEMQANSV